VQGIAAPSGGPAVQALRLTAVATALGGGDQRLDPPVELPLQ
jgi:hypothetical protein